MKNIKMEEYKEIVINWSELFLVKDIDNMLNNNIGTKNVLYQVYGDSHIYGRDVLLYIGQSKDIERRVKEHVNNVFGFVNNLKISVGKIEYCDNLTIPEAILIANHKPSYNKEFIHDLPELAKKNKIIVINNGNNLMLKTCCTNYWWTDK